MRELKARLLDAFRLKDLARSGWLRVGVEAPESVAAHSWGVAYLVLVLCPPELDRGRALAIAVIHDVAEARTGDITPHDGVAPESKHAAEASALEELTASFTNQEDLVALWREYEDQSTPEGRFVKACDKLDMALQAQRYRSPTIDTSELIASALKTLKDTTLRALARQDGHVDGTLERDAEAT